MLTDERIIELWRSNHRVVIPFARAILAESVAECSPPDRAAQSAPAADAVDARRWRKWCEIVSPALNVAIITEQIDAALASNPPTTGDK